MRVHETADPDAMILEYTLDGIRLSAGEPFTMTFVMVLTFRDGLIAHSRDYSDPIAGARAIGRLPDLVTTLTQEGCKGRGGERPPLRQLGGRGRRLRITGDHICAPFAAYV